jgi:hypothetical protein
VHSPREHDGAATAAPIDAETTFDPESILFDAATPV